MSIILFSLYFLFLVSFIVELILAYAGLCLHMQAYDRICVHTPTNANICEQQSASTNNTRINIYDLIIAYVSICIHMHAYAGGRFRTEANGIIRIRAQLSILLQIIFRPITWLW